MFLLVVTLAACLKVPSEERPGKDLAQTNGMRDAEPYVEDATVENATDPRGASVAEVPASLLSLIEKDEDDEDNAHLGKHSKGTRGSVSVPAKAWYTNMDASTDRRDAMEKAYRRTGIPYQRFSALAPSADDLFNNDRYAVVKKWIDTCAGSAGKALCALARHHKSAKNTTSSSSKANKPTTQANIAAVVGCTVSKAAVLELIQKEGKPGEVYLIAEDDYEPAPDLAARLPALLETVPAGWDVLKLDTKSGKYGHGANPPASTDGKVRKLAKWPEGSPKRGHEHFCGGSHALLVPFEKAGKLHALYSGEISAGTGLQLDADCMLFGKDFNNYEAFWGLFHPVRTLKRESTISPGHDGR